jgi:prevent-host-death family protein
MEEMMISKIVGVTELQRRFRTIFDEIVLKKTPYVLTRESRPEAVIIPFDLWERLSELSARIESDISEQYFDFWPEEESVDDFIAARKAARAEAARLSLQRNERLKFVEG